MKHLVLMPALGETMDEGVIVQWHRSPGEWVERGDVLLEVMTDKATFEVEATDRGYLREIVAQVDETVAVGRTIASLSDTMEEWVAEQEKSPSQTPPGHPKDSEPDSRLTPESVTPGKESRQTRLSPRARRLLEQYNLSLDEVTARFPGRPVEARDVETYWMERQASGPPSEVSAVSRGQGMPMSGMRATIAQRMIRSSRVPQVTLHTHSVVDRLLEMHRRFKEEPHYEGVSLTDWIIKLTAMVLLNRPDINARWFGDTIEQFSAANIGVAIETPHGLTVPVIQHAETLTLREIADRRRRLQERAMARRLAPADLSTGTFTVSNLGGLGVESFTPLINLPEVAILGVGRVDPVVVADGARFSVQSRLGLSLTFDHRAVDGGPAARFLAEVCQALSEPGEMKVSKI